MVVEAFEHTASTRSDMKYRIAFNQIQEGQEPTIETMLIMKAIMQDPKDLESYFSRNGFHPLLLSVGGLCCSTEEEYKDIIAQFKAIGSETPEQVDARCEKVPALVAYTAQKTKLRGLVKLLWDTWWEPRKKLNQQVLFFRNALFESLDIAQKDREFFVRHGWVVEEELREGEQLVDCSEVCTFNHPKCELIMQLIAMVFDDEE